MTLLAIFSFQALNRGLSQSALPHFSPCSKMITASETHKNLIRGCLPYAKIA